LLIKKHLIIHLLILLALYSSAQNADSLKISLKTQKADTQRVNILNTLSFEIKYADPVAAKIYCEEAIAVGEKLKFYKGLGFSYKVKGILYDEKGDYTEAVSAYIKSLSYYTKIGDKQGVARTEANIGIVLRKQKKDKEAINYFRRSYQFFKGNRPLFEVNILSNIGIAYMNLNENDSSFYYQKIAFDLMEANHIEIDHVYGNLGLAYTKLNNYQRAEPLVKKCLDMKKAEGSDISSIAVWCQNLANIYTHTNRNKEAIKLLEESAQLIGEEKYTYEATYTYNCLALAYEKENDLKNAFKYQKILAGIKDSIYDADNSKQMDELKEKYETDKKETEIRLLTADKVIQDEALQKNKIIIYAVSGLLILLLFFALFVIRSNREKQKTNKELLLKNTLIETQKKEVEQQKEIVDEKQKEIIDSITYAKRLQDAILPSSNFVNACIPGNFILYKPKDIVAGDFYWAEKIHDLFFIAAADSTGHGVPGALVSVVCSNALNRSVKEFHLTDTGTILDKTRELVLETFEKSSNDVKDGMDISLLCINLKTKHVTWSGANNPLWYMEGNTLKEIKADKQPIGKTEHPKPFTTHSITYSPGMLLYLFTDGYADQFGGPNGKKFKYNQLSALLSNNSHLPLKQQQELFLKTFNEWKGPLEQVDDVCMIGVRV
jgi:serine phosphatase RsbU (regulator of sigma subunit)